METKTLWVTEVGCFEAGSREEFEQAYRDFTGKPVERLPVPRPPAPAIKIVGFVFDDDDFEW